MTGEVSYRAICYSLIPPKWISGSISLGFIRWGSICTRALVEGGYCLGWRVAQLGFLLLANLISKK